ADKNVEIANLAKDKSTLSLDLARVSDAAQAASQQALALQTETASLREQAATALRQASELNQALSQTTNELDATERARRNLAEQLTQAQQEASRFRGVLEDRGIALDTPGGLGRGAVAVRGVVKDTREIAGSKYATI